MPEATRHWDQTPALCRMSSAQRAAPCRFARRWASAVSILSEAADGVFVARVHPGAMPGFMKSERPTEDKEEGTEATVWLLTTQALRQATASLAYALRREYGPGRSPTVSGAGGGAETSRRGAVSNSEDIDFVR